MPLTERQCAILEAVVERYIHTGEPVGSSAVTGALGMHVSSATVRNEMAELSARGFLEQPHTSAGRIPSTLGYRYYVDRLMGEREADESFRRFFAQIMRSGHDAAHIIVDAVSVLAEISQCAAVSTSPTGEGARLARVELVPLGENAALLVLLTDSGVIKNRLLKLDLPPPVPLLEAFRNLSVSALCGRKLTDITPAFLQSLTASLGAFALDLLPLLAAFADLSAEAAQTTVTLEGQMNLLAHKELAGNLGELITLLRDGNALHRVATNEGITVRIGTENNNPLLDNTGLILAKYRAGEQVGTLGIVGPARIDYARLIPGVRYLAKLLGEQFN
jgi:heat-inducible transcriptional repressor